MSMVHVQQVVHRPGTLNLSHLPQGQDVFYKQAAAGTLPQFSFINPPGEACDHPCHDMAKGERLLKDVYVSGISCVARLPVSNAREIR